jgi:aryl-alcohol dehydrogenase-like predicted oxidoreductase
VFAPTVTSTTSPSPVPAGLGLGTATFGREIDDATSHRLLDHAYGRGIRHLDTAVAYSAGAAERILGDWLRARPEIRAGLTIATKLLPPYSAAATETTVAASLGRLGLDRVDVLYLHRWDPTADQPEVRAALDALVRRGLVGAIGISNCSLEKLQAARAHQQAEGRTPFSWLQNNQNFAVREAPVLYRQYCAAQGISVVTFSPLAAGFLTGKHATGVVPGSRFAVVPAHGDIYFNPTCQRRLEVLLATARQHGLTPASLALAWALHRPLTRFVLIGGREAAQIEQAFAVSGADFAPALAELERAEPDGP